MLTYLVAVRTVPGQWLDMVILRRWFVLVPPFLRATVSLAGREALIVVLAATVLGLALGALWRRRWREVCAASLVVAGAVPATWYLRNLALIRPDLGSYGYDYNTMPSTHASAAFGLLVGLALLWPTPRTPGRLAVVAIVAALVFAGNVVSLAHRPSDVVASAFLVISWSALVLAVVRPRLTG